MKPEVTITFETQSDADRFTRAWEDGDADALESFGITEEFADVTDYFNASRAAWNTAPTTGETVYVVAD